MNVRILAGELNDRSFCLMWNLAVIVLGTGSFVCVARVRGGRVGASDWGRFVEGEVA